MTLRITVEPEAESEIGEAAGWYEDRLTGLGLEFLAAVDRAFSSITGNPERFPIWRQGHPFRRYLLKRFPSSFWAVAHAHRQPGNWVSRTPT